MEKLFVVLLLVIWVCVCGYGINIVITEHNIIKKVGKLVDEMLKERGIK